MGKITLYIISFIASFIVALGVFIYTNYDEGHDLDICILGQMCGLACIPFLNIMIAVAIFVDNMDFKFDCSKIILLKGKNHD